MFGVDGSGGRWNDEWVAGVVEDMRLRRDESDTRGSRRGAWRGPGNMRLARVTSRPGILLF